MVLENSNSGSGSGSASAQEHDFYSGAAERIPWFMVALGLAFATAAWWKFGPSTAMGFLGGAVIAFLNFQWLKSGVKGVADRVTQVGSAQSGKGIVFRFLLRYVLMGAAAYVILTSFPASLRGLFAGLFLPVGAIACEAVYETYAALIRHS